MKDKYKIHKFISGILFLVFGFFGFYGGSLLNTVLSSSVFIKHTLAIVGIMICSVLVFLNGIFTILKYYSEGDSK